MKKPFRVAYVATARGFSANNLPRKIISICSTWKQMGFSVSLICGRDVLYPHHQSQKMPRAYPRKFRSHPTNSGWYMPFINSMSEYRDLKFDRRLKRFLRTKFQSDLPHLLWHRPARLHQSPLAIARELGIPYVVEWLDHLIPYRFSMFRNRALEVERQCLREAYRVIVVSQRLAKDISQKYDIPQNRIMVAQNAVDPKEFVRDEQMRKERRKTLDIKDDEVLVGYVGSYAFYHDAVRLVLATEILRNRGFDKVKILMVGDGKEYPQVRRIAEKRNLLESILIMRPKVPLSEVPAILAALDIAVLPGSTDIICPIKVQEYMASELPAVVPDYPANREVIAHKVTGMLFKPKNENALAETISLLAQDSEMRTRLGRQARQEVLHRFTWERTWGAALEEILQRISRTKKERMNKIPSRVG